MIVIEKKAGLGGYLRDHNSPPDNPQPLRFPNEAAAVRYLEDRQYPLNNYIVREE